MTPFRTIVCALDLSDAAPQSLSWAADLAERAHASLHLVHADALFRARLAPAGADDRDEAFHRRVRTAVADAFGADDAFDVLAPELHETRGAAPADGILTTSAEVAADLIVTGTHGRLGVAHVLAGSVAAEVLRRATVPVLVVPDGAEHGPPGPGRPVLAAVDFSDLTRPTIEAAGRLAAAYGADVELVHVLDAPADTGPDLGGLFSIGDLRPAPGDSTKEAAAEALRRLADEAGIGGSRVIVGEPRSGLLRAVEGGRAGALVMGTHGRTGWDRLRLGSVAEWVVRHASSAVLTVPAPRA